MNSLRYTLVSDGSSDRALLPILTWLLRSNDVHLPIQSTWADLRLLPKQPKNLTDRIRWAIDLYPCELLFVHRDAERQPPHLRRTEIQQALDELIQTSPRIPPTICIIPVRMQEAWLLFDATAIRAAAGNPNGRQPLELPLLADIEHLADPKAMLQQLMRDASGLHGHRLRRMAFHAWRVTDFIEDFSPLRKVSAFQQLENELIQVIDQHHWHR